MLLKKILIDIIKLNERIIQYGGPKNNQSGGGFFDIFKKTPPDKKLVAEQTQVETNSIIIRKLFE